MLGFRASALATKEPFRSGLEVNSENDSDASCHLQVLESEGTRCFRFCVFLALSLSRLSSDLIEITSMFAEVTGAGYV